MTTHTLPVPGSTSFVPNIFRYLAAQESLAGWTEDPTIFSTLLLTMVVNRGGLIVTVGEEDGSSLHDVHVTIQHVTAVSHAPLLEPLG